MSEQSTIAEYGDTLFGRGPEAALQALGMAYQLAFMNGLSQLSTPGVSEIVDRTGHIGVAREIARYKTSLSLAGALAARAGTESDVRMQGLLNQLSCEFSDDAQAAGKRIINASAYASQIDTVQQAVGEIFQVSDDFVADLLTPTPGIDWSVHEIVGAIQDALASGADDATILALIQKTGVDPAVEPMTTLSLSLESYVQTEGAESWHAIAAQAGGAALLLYALFDAGYVPGLEINADTAFFQDPALADRVLAYLDSAAVDFNVVADYLPSVQALGWLVHSVDASFSTDDLNRLIDAAAATPDGEAEVAKLAADLQQIIAGATVTPNSDPASFYRSLFRSIDAVETAYPDGLHLESLVAKTADAITQSASESSVEGLAYRYALTELNGFVLVGADYSTFNTQGELDLYDEATGQGTFSPEYLADRPELLAAMVEVNLHDLLPNEDGTTVMPGLDTTLVDRDADVSLTDPTLAVGLVVFDGDTNAPLVGTMGRDRLYGEAGDDSIDGGSGDDYLGGGTGADVLLGGDGNDVLEGDSGADALRGGAGHDVLRGGAGADLMIGDGDGDVLEGGTGSDTYRIRAGDVIRDADGDGNIIFEGDETQDPILITGGGSVGDSDLYVSDDRNVVFRANDDGSVDFWVDGQRVTVLPGDEEAAGPRSRREDGAPLIDQPASDEGSGGGGPVGGKPMLGLPLRRQSGPPTPNFRTPFLDAQAVPAPRRDPLVLDLDGDGIETLGQQAVTFFDHDANGFAELTGWVSGDDGLLAMDRDGDGRIGDGRELFGDRTVLASGAVATSGLQALAEWDLVTSGGNADGVIDATDNVWSSLRVWRDTDGDGYSDAGELFGLADLGISAISLSFTDSAAGDGQGNTQARVGSFTRSDGTVSSVGEYLLARNAAVTIAEQTVALSADVAGMPEVRGSGDVYDLRQAMARDSQLQRLVAQFVAEADVANRDILIDSILFRWAGADGIAPNSRGGAIDARKLAVLEQFLGERFVGALGADPVPDAAIQLERAWHELSEQVYGKLMAQSQLHDLYDSITYRWDAASGSVVADLSAVTATIDGLLATDFATGKVALSEFARTMRAMHELSDADYQQLRQTYAVRSEELAIAFDSGGLNYVPEVSGAAKQNGTTGADILVGGLGSDSVMGFDGDDVIYGLEGDDILSGCEDHDQLFGGLGNDSLFGGLGNDLLDGGAGNDYLNGGLGNDTYLLARGMGFDRIRDYDETAGNVDVIKVDAAILSSEVRYWRKGNDLYIGIDDSSDGMLVENWFAGLANRIEAIVFDDGTQIGADQLAQSHYVGTDGADVMLGSVASDVLEGLVGNDSIIGGTGDDVLDGGAGNDTLYGGSSGYFAGAGAGNDTYVFGHGYGQDTVYDYDGTAGNTDTILLKDLNAGDVTIRRDAGSFYIEVNGSSDRLRVADWGSGADYRIERIVFADGSVLQGAELVAPFLGTAGDDALVGTGQGDVLRGLDGNDSLSAGAGDDVLDGGAGDDTLYGGVSGYASNAGAGNDTYVFGLGYGHDTIYDYDTTAGNVDTILLKDLHAGDVTIRRDSGSFYIEVNNSNDRLRVADWNLGSGNRIERVVFADGSVLEGAALVAPFLGTGGNDAMVGTVEGDVLRGLDGNDSLSGGAGDDVLDGGGGNDTLYGGVSGYFPGAGAGNDTYVFGSGYGQDTVYDYDATAGNVDTVLLKDLNAGDVTIRRDNNTFYIEVNGSSDRLQVADWGLGAAYRIERVVFADGSVLEGAALAATPFLGTAASEALFGTADNDVLRGLAGNDSLYGGVGNDLLDGGAGNDTLYGGTSGYAAGAGAGNDTYVFARGYGQDTVYDFDSTPGNIDTVMLLDLNASDVTIRRDQSYLYVEVNGTTDRVRVADWGLGAAYRVERIQFADGTALNATDLANIPYLGTAAGDNIIGTADNEVMRGFGGNDMLAGGAGDDVLEGGDGNDTLKGEDGNDVLIGNDGNDTLYAGAGNDLLDGGAGNDRMFGYGGDDVFWVESGADYVYENYNEGNDTVIASIDYTLGSYLENLTLIGTANLKGTGNAWDNQLRGNAGDNLLNAGAGNDFLDGGAGADKMIGGTGDDTYVVDNPGDIVVENANEGIDIVRSSVARVLSANVENLILTGTDNIDGTGNVLNNRIEGNSGNNVLDGAAGADTVIGGAGDDTYIVDNAGDAVVEEAGGGIDTVRSAVTRTLSANVESLALTGAAAIDGTGNELSNVISGNDADNVLAGMAGDDFVSGGEGNDSIDGGAGNDVLQGGSGNDVLQDAAGANLLDGGSGADQIAAHGEASFVAGGAGDDHITATGAASVVAYNAGDGNDTIHAEVERFALSLAGQLHYDELALRRAGNNLVLEISSSESVTMEGWYDEQQVKPQFLRLQVMTTAMEGFDVGGSDPLLNARVQQFDLKALAAYYDAVRTEDPSVDRWAMMHKLLDSRLGAYDAEALGGELAQSYAANGSLTGVALATAQGTLAAPSFGRDNQPLTDPQQLSQNGIKLG